ncbi:MAG: xanthine dehydrogenase family protein subunit M [Acidobacteriota bacterium]
MKPAAFDYRRPATVDEVVALLAEHGDEAKVLAGGQSLVPAMNFRLAQPRILIDLQDVAGLDHLEESAGALRIGAMCRQRQVERSPLVAERTPLLAAAMPSIAHPQIRNRGTFGGSLAHADPASELPAVLAALGGRLRVRRQSAEEWVAVDDFFVSLFTTALGSDGLLLEVEVPFQEAASGWAFEEFSRRHGDYALVGVAVVLGFAGARCRHARIALFSVGEGPVRARRAEELLQAGSWEDADAATATLQRAASTAAQEDIEPPGDIHASADYRRHLAEVLTGRTLRRAAERAGRSL